MSGQTRLYVGTKKGGFRFTSCDGRASWQTEGPILKGWSLNHLIEDLRDRRRVYAAANHAVWGPIFPRSCDGGQTWDEQGPSPAFPADDGRTVAAAWCVRPGHADHPGELWAGADPAALFRSEDWGQSWQPVPGLTDHPTRQAGMWQPGGGGLIIHNVSLDPTNADSLIATISAGGVFRSDDGGESWRPLNRGVRAGFMPDPSVEAGHCVHRLERSPADPNFLFQQNHCGAYRSADGGETWQEVTDGLPSEFGFAAAAHPHEPRTFYCAPLVADAFRAFHDGKMTIWRTRDGGDSWEPLRCGLPQENAYLCVYRGAMATDGHDPAGVYVGTSTGQVFASRDGGDSWSLIADYLPPVLSLTAASDG